MTKHEFDKKYIQDIEISGHAQERYYTRVMCLNGDPEKVIDKIEDDFKSGYLAKLDNDTFGFFNKEKMLFFPFRGGLDDKHVRTTMVIKNERVKEVIAELNENLKGKKV